MEQLLDNRSTLVAASGDREFVPVAENLEEEYKEQALSPIICAGDVLGAVTVSYTHLDVYKRQARHDGN